MESSLDLLSKYDDISFQEYVSKRISHPVFYVDLAYKLRGGQRHNELHLVEFEKSFKKPSTKLFDPFIMLHIGLVFGPYPTLNRRFLKRCTLTNKAAGTIWWALSKPLKRRQGPDLHPL